MTGSNRRLHFLIAVWAIVLLAGCNALGPWPDLTILASDQVNLPTVRDYGLLFVDVRLNGVGPYRLLVDTGTTGVVLCDDVAKASGLKPIEAYAAITPAGKVGVESARLKRLESGGLTLEGLNVEVMTIADAALFRRAFGRFDGFMGFGAFRDVLLRVNFPDAQVSVTRPHSQPQPPVNALTYTTGSDMCPYVLIDFFGRSVPALLDTGNNHGIIAPELDQLSLQASQTDSDKGGGVAIGSTHIESERNVRMIGVIRSGPLSWNDPMVCLPSRGQKKGNIGVAALDTWTLVFDQQSHLIYFTGAPLSRTWPK